MGVDNIKFAKPALAKWRVVQKRDDLFEVRDPNLDLYATYPTRQAAEAARVHGQRRDDDAARRMVRPCMCCQKSFESEGIHNRLCATCRHSGTSYNPHAVAPRNGRPR